MTLRKINPLTTTLFVLFWLGSSTLCLADPTVLFETVLEGHPLGHGLDIAVDAEGNAYISGAFQGDGIDLLVAKLDDGGNLLWQREILGDSHDVATGILLDDSGRVTIVGWTDSTDFPTTPGSFQPERVAGREGFMIQLAPDDGALEYGTFVGGGHTETVEAIAQLADGRYLLAGSTDSPDFPTVNALQPNLGNGPYQFSDGFVAVLSADRTTLTYSTYLGADRDDVARAVALLSDGSWAIAGETDSFEFPIVGGVQDTFAGGTRDAFVAVLSDEGASLRSSTYLGGEDWEFADSLAATPDDSLYLAGSTSSLGFPLADPVQAGLGGGANGCAEPHIGNRNCFDGYVAKLSPGLDQLLFGTYLGGDGDEFVSRVVRDSSGNIRVVGLAGASYEGTSGPDGQAVLVAQYGALDNDLDYAVKLSSNTNGNIQGLALSPVDGSIYVTASSEMPADVLVARLVDPSFADGFESGDTSNWSSTVSN